MLFLGMAVIAVACLAMRKKRHSQVSLYGVIMGCIAVTYCGLFEIVGEPMRWLLWQVTGTKAKVMAIVCATSHRILGSLTSLLWCHVPSST